MSQTFTFTEINLDKENYNKEFVSDFQTLANLNRLNIFIGANNSGKSRFLRKLFVDKELEFHLEEIDILSFDEEFNRFGNDYYNNVKNLIVYDFADLANDFNLIDEFKWLKTINSFEKINKQIDQNKQKLNNDISIAYAHKIGGARQILNQFERFYDRLIQPRPSHIFQVKFESIYIPAIRGLRPINSGGANDSFNDKDVYKFRTIKDYEFQSDITNIYSGLGFYHHLDEHSRNVDFSKIRQVQEFELFLSNTFFDNQSVKLTATHGKDVVSVGIGENQRQIFDLGDGIQAIIILLYPLFFNQGKNLKVFIEEPEINLHPGFQRLLIETLLHERFSSFQYFITTHSNHFLDLTLETNDISVYTFKQEADKKFKITNVENADSNVLSLIGVKNSSVFLSNCTIWVEGISDRIYIRKYLDILQGTPKKYLEDIHYSFVEYGGNNITHWSFLDDDDPNHPNINVDRICSKAFLICDNDGNENIEDTINEKDSAKLVRLKKLKKKLPSGRFECLKRKEIENIISVDLLKKIIQEYEPSNSDLDFSKLKYEGYQKSGLGAYIEKNVIGIKRKYKELGKTETLKDKVNFAKIAVKNMDIEEELSIDAKNLAEKLLRFIKSNN